MKRNRRGFLGGAAASTVAGPAIAKETASAMFDNSSPYYGDVVQAAAHVWDTPDVRLARARRRPDVPTHSRVRAIDIEALKSVSRAGKQMIQQQRYERDRDKLANEFVARWAKGLLPDELVNRYHWFLDEHP